MIKGLKKKNKNVIHEFGLEDMGSEISMLSEIATLQGIMLHCQKKRNKVEEKLEIFRKRRKTE